MSADVDLEDGVAVVTMDVDPKYSQLIHDDASALLRPGPACRTWWSRSTPAAMDSPAIAEGATIGSASTKPNVNVDQILASLDGDTHAYLRLLLAGGAEALRRRPRPRALGNVLRRLEPTTRDIAKINGALSKRRDNLRRVITNFGADRRGGRRPTTSSSPTSSPPRTRCSAPSPTRRQNLRATLRGLPGALKETRDALDRRQQPLRSSWSRR